MAFHKSTLVARGANAQLDPSYVSAPPRTNVDLFACFAERLLKSSSIGRVSLARENEAGGSWGQEVHIFHVNV